MMAKKNGNYWMFKAPLELRRELDRIRIERIKKGKDTRQVSYNRLGLAISRHERFLQDLINADLLEEERRRLK